MKLLITGATGYIGQRLVTVALAKGCQVIEAGRKPSARAAAWMYFDLANPLDIDFPPDVDAVVHLAVVTSPNPESEAAEVAAARALLDAATRAGVPFLFVSSQTARMDAPTAYGRSKWQIEQSVLAQNGWVVRPGQVYGREEAGLFGMLTRIVRRLPVLPAFIPAPCVQPVHVDDLVRALLTCLEQRPASGIFQIAEPSPISFTSFLAAIAQGRVRKRRLFVPIPVLLVKCAIAVLGRERSRRMGLERLLSLFSLPRMRTQTDLDRLALNLRPLRSGMANSGSLQRRWLIEEGRAMLNYVLRGEPACELVRRYARAVEQLRPVGALDLPALVLRNPSLFVMLEGGGAMHSTLRPELAWRFHAAVTLAEASPQGARRFLGLGDRRQGGLVKAFYMCRALISEIVSRIARWLVIPVVAGLGGKKGVRK